MTEDRERLAYQEQEVESSTEDIEQTLQLENQFKNGARWFYWIAGLSLLNSVVVLLANGNWNFVIGLGATQFVDGVALFFLEDLPQESALLVKSIALGVDAVLIGLFFLFGFLALKGKRAAFIVGIALYALDGLLFLLLQDWFGLGFHAFALFSIFGGLSALNQLRANIEQEPDVGKLAEPA